MVRSLWEFSDAKFYSLGNFRLFQQARCEVIVKYTNCNLLEHERIRTGIRTIEAQIDEKIRILKLGKMFLVLIKEKECIWPISFQNHPLSMYVKFFEKLTIFNP